VAAQWTQEGGKERTFSAPRIRDSIRPSHITPTPPFVSRQVLAGESIVLVSHVSAVHEGFIHQSSASTPDGTGFQLQLSTEKNKIGWKMAVQDSKIMKKKTLLEVPPVTSIERTPL
jgi:hypothetical protein